MNVTDNSALSAAVEIAGKLSREIALSPSLRRNDPDLSSGYSLENGLAGVALFYAELYRATQNPKYLNRGARILHSTLKFLSQENNFNYGFMNGKTGICYVFLFYFTITGKDHFLDSAVTCMKRCGHFVSSTRVSDALYTGRAGVLAMLIQLYRHRPDRELGDLIGATTEGILRNIRFSRHGVSWYGHRTQLDGMVGWGFGALGTGYALNQAADLLASKGLEAIARRAFHYCESKLNSRDVSWKYDQGELDLDPKSFMKLQKKNHEIDPERLAENHDDLGYGLTGILIGSGIVGSFKKKTFQRCLQMSQRGARGKCRSIAEQNAWLYLGRKLSKDEANPRLLTGRIGLASGLAGLGYQQLIKCAKVNDPYFTARIDCPRLQAGPDAIRLYGMEPGETHYFILSKHFYRTIALLNKNQTWFGVHLFKHSVNEILFVRNLRGMVRQCGNGIYADAFRLDYAKFRFHREAPANCLREHCNRYLSFVGNIKLQGLSDDRILAGKYKLNPRIMITRSRWDLAEPTFYLDLSISGFKTGDYYFMISHTTRKGQPWEVLLADAESLLLNMQHPVTGNALVKQIVRHFAISDPEPIRRSVVELILSKTQENVLWLVRRALTK